MVSYEQIFNVVVHNTRVLSDVIGQNIGVDEFGGCMYDHEPNSLRVIRLSDNPTHDDMVSNIVLTHGILTLTRDKTTIEANDLEFVTIQCSDDEILADFQLDWFAYLDNELMLGGTVDVVDGVATLEFKTPLVGEYLIRLASQSFFEDGYITIEAI